MKDQENNSAADAMIGDVKGEWEAMFALIGLIDAIGDLSRMYGDEAMTDIAESARRMALMLCGKFFPKEYEELVSHEAAGSGKEAEG